ncbi:unnamed protein product [Discula destructiva]
MKYTSFALAAALAAQKVSAHATWQNLWVDGVDYDTQCARIPVSNSPVTDVTSPDMACNAGTAAVSSNCPVTAGSTITVEMHQQPNDRSCSNEALGGAHYGPVIVYMAAVADATAAAGADSAWFKVFEDTWSSNGASGSEDNWGTKDLNTCCGMMNVLIPADIAPGDYLLRAEAIALHTAGSAGGAQFYMTCYQLTVTGTGTAAPESVAFPGAYSANDPGILINIYQAMTAYEAPGPAVYAGGSTKEAGAACEKCESTCAAGSGSTGVATSGAAAAAAAVETTSAAPVSTTLASSTVAAPTSSVLASSSAAPYQSQVPSASAPVQAAPTSAYAASGVPVASMTPSSYAAEATGKTSCKRRRSRRSNK